MPVEGMVYALRSLRKEGESGLWIGPQETLFPLGAPSFLPLERRRTGYRRGLRWMIFMAFWNWLIIHLMAMHTNT